jgi:hypothetical protein
VRCVEHERHPMSEPKNQELPPHGVNTSWNDGFQGEELQQKILEARERQLSAALAEIGELKETVKHFESAPFFTRNLLANDGQMEGKDYAALTDADFKTLFEYSATCKCQGCAEIGYIITLRAERDRMAEALRKTEGCTTYPTHKQMCEMLGAREHAPSPEWLPYTVRKTKLEVYVDGDRRHVFGGSHVCGTCGFGVDMIPDEHTTPKARSDGGCPKCGALSVAAPPETARAALKEGV